MKRNIAVLGAGPMGLAVAYQLVRDGYQPVIYEADDRVGGMSAMFDFDGLSIERFYHFHCTSDIDFMNLLEELGINKKLHWVETKMGFWYQDRLQNWGNPVALLKFRGLSLLAKIRYGVHAFFSVKRNQWEDLDGKNALEWVKSWVGSEAYVVLWQKLFDYKFYHFSDNLSAAWIWSRIRRVGRSRYNIFKEKLGYLEGGSATLMESMRAYIESRGARIHLSKNVEEIVLDGNKLHGVLVNGKLVMYDTVISTIPLPYIPRLIPSFPEDVLNKYRVLDNIAVVCVIVKLSKPLSSYFWLNINSDDMDIPGLVEYSNLNPISNHIVYVPFYMPQDCKKYQDSDDVFKEKVKKYLKDINSRLIESDFTSIYVNRYKYAQPICPPNFLKALPPYKTKVENLWIADTSYYYPEDRGISESIKFGRNMAMEATK